MSAGNSSKTSFFSRWTCPHCLCSTITWYCSPNYQEGRKMVMKMGRVPWLQHCWYHLWWSPLFPMCRSNSWWRRLDAEPRGSIFFVLSPAGKWPLLQCHLLPSRSPYYLRHSCYCRRKRMIAVSVVERYCSRCYRGNYSCCDFPPWVVHCPHCN